MGYRAKETREGAVRLKKFDHQKLVMLKCDEYKKYPCEEYECIHINHCLVYPKVGELYKPVKVQFD